MYWCIRSRTAYPFLGPLVYVGETDHLHRRIFEHITRSLKPESSTQQPFFDVIRQRSQDPARIRALVAEWLFIPIWEASVCQRKRRDAEQDMIFHVGTLNPPKVHSLLRFWAQRHRVRHVGPRFVYGGRPSYAAASKT